MTLSDHKLKAFFYVMLCVLMWAFIPVVSRFGQQQLDHFQFLFWSSVLSTGVLFLCTIFRNKVPHFKKYSTPQLFSAFGLGFLGTFLYYLLLYFGYMHAKGLEVLVIQYLWPVFIVIFSIFFLKERLSFRTFLAVVLGFLGVLVVLTKGDFTTLHLENMKVDGIVLLAAATFGLFSVLSKKAHFEPFTATTLFFLSACIWSTLSLILFSFFTLPTRGEWLPILINGVLINGLSYIFWLRALSLAKASFVAPFIFLIPILSSVLIVLFFKEPFLPIYIVGIGLVIGAGLLSK